MGNYKKILLLLFFLILISVLLGLPGFAWFFRASDEASTFQEQGEELPKLITIQNNSVIGISSIGAEGSTSIVLVTAYSSDPAQTDDTPHITAPGSYVREGIIAANFLPFGTKVTFPTLFGDKVFIVEDRMKSNHRADIWFPSREQALAFGVRKASMVILGND